MKIEKFTKIWISTNPDVFLPKKNQNRIMQFLEENQHNQDRKLTLLYDHSLLSAEGVQQFNDFCQQTNILFSGKMQFIDVRTPEFTAQLKSETERELYTLYEAECNHLGKGGNPGAASDILRLLHPCFKHGVYTDFDVYIKPEPVELPNIADRSPVVFPIEIDLRDGLFQGFYNNKDGLFQGFYNNNDVLLIEDYEIMTDAGKKAIAKERIKQLQTAVVHAYQNNNEISKHINAAYQEIIHGLKQYQTQIMQFENHDLNSNSDKEILKAILEEMERKVHEEYNLFFPTDVNNENCTVIQKLFKLRQYCNNLLIFFSGKKNDGSVNERTWSYMQWIIKQFVSHLETTFCMLVTNFSGPRAIETFFSPLFSNELLKDERIKELERKIGEAQLFNFFRENEHKIQELRLEKRKVLTEIVPDIVSRFVFNSPAICSQSELKKGNVPVNNPLYPNAEVRSDISWLPSRDPNKSTGAPVAQAGLFGNDAHQAQATPSPVPPSPNSEPKAS